MNDLSQLRVMRDKAKALLEDEAFKAALERMKERLLGELLEAKTTEQKLELIGSLRTTSTIDKEIEALIRDYTEAKRHA